VDVRDTRSDVLELALLASLGLLLGSQAKTTLLSGLSCPGTARCRRLDRQGASCDAQLRPLIQPHGECGGRANARCRLRGRDNRITLPQPGVGVKGTEGAPKVVPSQASPPLAAPLIADSAGNFGIAILRYIALCCDPQSREAPEECLGRSLRPRDDHASQGLS
jgi:hypothetical protein